MSEAVHYERVREQFESLNLGAALAELDPLLEKASREERSPTWLLDQLFTTHRIAFGMPMPRGLRGTSPSQQLGSPTT